MVKISIESTPVESISGGVDVGLRARVVAALKTVLDPELPVNIYDLGLIYRLDIDAARNVDIDMTLTAPNCPVAGEMPGHVLAAVQAVEGVASAKVALVWTPKWDKSLMTEAARLECGLF